MKPRRGLLRFLVGSGRLEIVEHLSAHGRARHTINELARETRVPLATTWRAVRDLVDLGILRIEHVAPVVLVELNQDSPILPRLKALLELDLPTPHLLAYEHFAKRIKEELPAVHVSLFGSVGRGTETPSSDVDVQVVYGGTGERREKVLAVSTKAAIEASDLYRVPLTPIVVRRPMKAEAG